MLENSISSFPRRHFWHLIAGVFIMAISACSSTTVVLVPDPDGKVGEVSVTTAAGTRMLTTAGESTTVSNMMTQGGEPKILTEEAIVSVFGSTLDNEPLPPERHILFFIFDTADLRPESLEILPHIYQAIVMRQVCDVSVNGHSDRMGRAAYNEKLSMQRARRVRDELINLGLDTDCLHIHFYGESDPLVPTADGVAKQVNRRVEIEIR